MFYAALTLCQHNLVAIDKNICIFATFLQFLRYSGIRRGTIGG
nr:MAG TPA: hypothetical protein [Caudoviricetes sp.]